jgi:hypothetical protein
MNEQQLTLTAEECTYLLELLERTLKETRVEEHRTRTPSYREGIVRDENHIVSILRKLGKTQT